MYIALGFGCVVFVLLVLGMLYNNFCKRKKSESQNHLHNAFLHSEKSLSSFGSITASSVQPKSQSTFPDTTRIPSNYNGLQGKGMNFGSFNVHQQQPPSAFATETLLQNLHERNGGNNGISTNISSGRGSMAKADSIDGSGILERKESFWNEYEREKSPLQLRVEEKNRQSSAYYGISGMTPEEIKRLDSIPAETDDM